MVQGQWLPVVPLSDRARATIVEVMAPPESPLVLKSALAGHLPASFGSQSSRVLLGV